jgi:hypothetical protein
MQKTKSEMLLGRIGQKAECEICHHQKMFTQGWRMTSGKVVVCPDCQPEISKSGKILVNI